MRKRRSIIGFTMVIVLTVIIILVIGGINVVNANKINDSIELGIKYLTEEEYNKAKSEFSKALAIDDEHEEAENLLELTEEYMELEDLYKNKDYSAAAELIYERADADKPHMGLTTWAAAPEGKIVKSDVSVAKNYLSEKEMRSLERIVSAYLDLAEDRAERHIPMTMEDWAKRLDLFLMADDREVLQDAGKITAEIAKAKAETEFEKYRVIQDRLFMSDFDKYMLELEENAKK